jgi:hypothetical protein
MQCNPDFRIPPPPPTPANVLTAFKLIASVVAPWLCSGILFYGEPGTGKTLAARALAGACARHSPAPVTFFARKGADCLGKFSGEAERTLRLLFEEVGRADLFFLCVFVGGESGGLAGCCACCLGRAGLGWGWEKGGSAEVVGLLVGGGTTRQHWHYEFSRVLLLAKRARCAAGGITIKHGSHSIRSILVSLWLLWALRRPRRPPPAPPPSSSWMSWTPWSQHTQRGPAAPTRFTPLVSSWRCVQPAEQGAGWHSGGGVLCVCGGRGGALLQQRLR